MFYSCVITAMPISNLRGLLTHQVYVHGGNNSFFLGAVERKAVKVALSQEVVARWVMMRNSQHYWYCFYPGSPFQWPAREKQRY